MNETATLLISCPDRRGILSEITRFIAENNGNIIHADQHIDSQKGIFFSRIEWDLSGFKVPRGKIKEAFLPIANRFSMSFDVHFSSEVPNVAIFVSKQGHCLYDLLYRFKLRELRGKPKLIVSNHMDLKHIADDFGIDFYCLPKSSEDRFTVEEKELELLRRNDIKLVILARYMQILSGRFVDAFPNRIINIHHSFLPAFMGARPYYRAFERGVKIIGATSHYVTRDLDQGPIIEQDVVRVSHRDTVEDMIRKGRDLEKVVLARALKWHLESKILVYDNKTVIFD